MKTDERNIEKNELVNQVISQLFVIQYPIISMYLKLCEGENHV